MSAIDDAAELLVKARRSGERLAELPASCRPETLGEAYAIQDAVVRALGVPVGGWKVAPMMSDTPPFCAPILADVILPSPGSLSPSTLAHAEIEVEIAVRFAADLPPRPAPYRRDEVVAAIGAVHPALEILDTRYTSRTGAPLFSTIADAQSNGAVVFGSALDEWQSLDFGAVAITLAFDGTEAGTASGGAATDQVLAALTWLADHAASRGWPLRAGQIVITGARVGPIAAPKGARIDAELLGIGGVSAVYR